MYEQMEQYLNDNLECYLDLLQQMVAINSFTANADGVNALGRLTAELFAPLGFTAETVPSAHENYGRHLILTRPGKTAKTIGMVSHLDTVFPPDEEIRNDFRWRPEGDRLYGPGTVDIKGGTVIMYMMLDALRAHAPDKLDAVNWVLLLDANEEDGGADFGELCADRLAGPETLACLIFEGGSKVDNDFQIVVARKGMATFHIEVEGRAAHAGSWHPHGANAIVQLAQTIQTVTAVTDYDRGVTVNVGAVQGGTVTNRVPHFAAADLEMRAFDRGVFAEAVAAITGVAGEGQIRSADDGYPTRLTVTQTRATPPWPRNDATDRLFALWQEAGAALGYTILPEERGGLSDGNFFWDRIPSIDGLGPSGGNAHCSERSADGSKDQEFALRSSFVPKALLNVTAVLRLLEGI